MLAYSLDSWLNKLFIQNRFKWIDRGSKLEVCSSTVLYDISDGRNFGKEKDERNSNCNR